MAHQAMPKAQPEEKIPTANASLISESTSCRYIARHNQLRQLGVLFIREPIAGIKHIDLILGLLCGFVEIPADQPLHCTIHSPLPPDHCCTLLQPMPQFPQRLWFAPPHRGPAVPPEFRNPATVLSSRR